MVCCALVLAACGQGRQVTGLAAAPSGSAEPTASASAPTPIPVPEPAEPTTSPLSGRTGGVDTPVMVVKLDNTRHAQPHRNLRAADIVYVEPVEWGLTRLAAVYSTTIPEEVGPVRSARVSDIELFAPYGPIAFVYSGAQTRLQPKLYAADWTAVSEDNDSAGFHRDYSRRGPYNLMAEPEAILDAVGPVVVSQDMGLVFDDGPVAGGRRATLATARWPESQMEFRWNKKAGAYDVWMNGSQARDTAKPGVQRASTVVVQYVKEVDSGYGDKFGGVTPRSITVGSGKGLVLRDGRAHSITWERANAEDPTEYLDADGQPMAFDPGQVWILLKDRTSKVQVESASSDLSPRSFAPSGVGT